MRRSVQDMLQALESSKNENNTLINASHAFHFCVIAAAKNSVLENIYRNLYDLLEVSKQHTMGESQVSDATLMDHEAILSKIEGKNSDEAAKYMRFHLVRAMKKADLEKL